MKQVESDILYSQVTIQIPGVPATYEEVDKLLGATGAALDGWWADNLARNFLPRLYANVAKQLNSFGLKHGVAKTLITTVKDPTTGADVTKETPVEETDIKFIGATYKNAPDTSEDPAVVSKTWIVNALQTAAREIPIYAAGDRAGSGKVAQAYIDSANAIFTGGDAKVDEAVGIIESNVPGYKVERDPATQRPTQDGVARGVAALDKHLKAKAAAQTQALLSGASAAE